MTALYDWQAEGDPRPTREIDISSCTDPDCPICHGAAGHGGSGGGK